MVLEEFSKTAIEVTGWTWTIFEHILAIGYITLYLWLISKWLKFNNKNIKLALYISFITTIISFLIEISLPIKLALMGLPLIFLVSAILIKLFYKENWKKSLLSALILHGLILATNITLGFILAIFKLLPI